MAILINLPANRSTAGRVTEDLLVVAFLLTQPRCWCRPTGVETKLLQFELDIKHKAGGTDHAPDHRVFGLKGDMAIYAGIQCKGVLHEPPAPYNFSIPYDDPDWLTSWGAQNRCATYYALARWNCPPQDVRFCTPSQVKNFGAISLDQRYWVLDASMFPTAAEWLDRYQPYGGLLPDLPPPSNVVQLPYPKAA